MAGFIDSVENALLDLVFGGTSYSAPATYYLELHATAPSEDGTRGTELTGGGYSRYAVTNDGSLFGTTATNEIDNDSDINWWTPSADLGVATHLGISNASSGGGLLAFAALTTPKTISDGTPIKFKAGELIIRTNGWSTYLAAVLLNHMFGGSAFSPAATLYPALFITAPNFSTGSGGTEVSGGSYARPSITNNTTNFPNASGGTKSNGTAVNYATPTASWGTTTSFGYYDASSAGNFYGGANLATSRLIQTNDEVRFGVGALTVSLD